MRMALVTLGLLALAGCGAPRPSADTGTTSETARATGAATSETSTHGGGAGDGAPGSEAVVAAAPRQIEALTSQRLVYQCPTCGMDFDAVGRCSMDGAELVEMRVDYLCPMDGQAVRQAGRCPRCPMNARIERTAMAVAPRPGRN